MPGTWTCENTRNDCLNGPSNAFHQEPHNLVMSTPHKTRHRRATLSNKDFITPPTSPADHPPLPKHAEKHLAQAIVLGGGPDAFSGSQAISRLCDTRPDIYGQRGDNRRRQISNKVNYWKTLNSTKFQTRVLDQLGVISPEPSTEKSNHKTLTDSDSDSDSDSDNPPSSAVELIVPSPVQELQQMKGMSSKTETALPGGACKCKEDYLILSFNSNTSLVSSFAG